MDPLGVWMESLQGRAIYRQAVARTHSEASTILYKAVLGATSYPFSSLKLCSRHPLQGTLKVPKAGFSKMMQKPLLLRIQDPGPNPQKVAIIIEELGLPYEVEFIEPDVSATSALGGGAPPVQDKNTGMIILTDPNTNVTLWESLALVEYLTTTYDVDGELSYSSKSSEFWQARQWLAYQMGAQSPFYSLKAWFSNQHAEKVDSVIERFADDVNRILGIMEHYLKKNGTGYLVGSKCTYADLEFVAWNNKLKEVMGDKEASELMEKAPHFRKWHDTLMARPAVQRVMRNPNLNAGHS